MNSKSFQESTSESSSITAHKRMGSLKLYPWPPYSAFSSSPSSSSSDSPTMDPRASYTPPSGSLQFRNCDSLGRSLLASSCSSSTPPETTTKSLIAIQNGISLEDVLAYPIDWIRYLETERSYQWERSKSQSQMNSPPGFSGRGWNEKQICDPPLMGPKSLARSFDEETEMGFYSEIRPTSSFSTWKRFQPESVAEEEERDKVSLAPRPERGSNELLEDSLSRGIGQVYDYDQFSQDALGSSNW